MKHEIDEGITIEKGEKVVEYMEKFVVCGVYKIDGEDVIFTAEKLYSLDNNGDMTFIGELLFNDGENKAVILDRVLLALLDHSKCTTIEELKSSSKIFLI